MSKQCLKPEILIEAAEIVFAHKDPRSWMFNKTTCQALRDACMENKILLKKEKWHGKKHQDYLAELLNDRKLAWYFETQELNYEEEAEHRILSLILAAEILEEQLNEQSNFKTN